MDIKNIYSKARDLNLKRALEVPKYLFGYDIHQGYREKRQEIRNSEDNLRKRILELSKNYAAEGARQVLRYGTLAGEGVIVYASIVKSPFLLFFLSSPVLVMAMEQASIRIYRIDKGVHDFSDNLNDFSDNLNDFYRAWNDFYSDWNDLSRDWDNFDRSWDGFSRRLEDLLKNPRFKAFWKGELLEDPYSVLGLDKTASERDVKKAYRAIAWECRPDLAHGDKEKEKRFIQATEAYRQLIDYDLKAKKKEPESLQQRLITG